MAGRPVIVISEDRALASTLASGLGAGFHVSFATDAAQLDQNARGVAVLDARSSERLVACRQLRDRLVLPVITITAGGDAERLAALRAGAEDCMSQPVNVAELAARIDKIEERLELKAEPTPDGQQVVSIDDLRIDLASHRVTVGDKEISLTNREFHLLLLLARRKGSVVTRKELMRRVWADCDLRSDRTIDVHVCRLRRKIEGNCVWPRRLVLVRGLGYRLQAAAGRPPPAEVGSAAGAALHSVWP